MEISPAINGTEDVRLIGIDAPEMTSDCGEQPLAQEAQDYTATFVGQRVALEFDEERVAQYDRLLAYVYTVDGQMLNEALVREGLAQVATFPPNTRYEDRFMAAQSEAIAAGRGIWGLPLEESQLLEDRGNGIGGGCTPPPAPEPAPSEATPQAAPDTPSEDLDCADFATQEEAQAQLLPGDPHGLDADGDGVACESISYGSPAPQPAPQQTPEPSPAPVTPSPPPPDVDCSDFPELGNPQDWYFPGDPHRLDRDNDGLACEPY